MALLTLYEHYTTFSLFCQALFFCLCTTSCITHKYILSRYLTTVMLNKVVDKNLKVWYNMCIEQRTFYVSRYPTHRYPRRRFDRKALI